ncbi:MAG TPA: pre-peptidase C-terminal domain-containing protein [Lacunisphaera sp.]|nr:pre-peptidase C-terminal domain-containing protein [Lacunisphaera sp.]
MLPRYIKFAFGIFVAAASTAFGQTNVVLANGVPVTSLSGAEDSQVFYAIKVPAGASKLAVKISGGTGDCDIYVRRGIRPTLAAYDARPYLPGNVESVTVNYPAADTWYIMLHGFFSYGGVTLVVTTDTVLTSGVAVSGLSGALASEQHFLITVPNGAELRLQTFGGTGNCDVYARYGSAPTTSSYDHRGNSGTNTEAVAIGGASAGIWHIMVSGASAYSGVTLVVTTNINLYWGISAYNLSGAAGAQLYFVTAWVPAGATKLRVTTDGGTGDCDLYVRRVDNPTTSIYDYNDYSSSNSGTVEITNPASGPWFVMVRGYEAFEGVNLKAEITQPLAVTAAVTGPGGVTAGQSATFNITATGAPTFQWKQNGQVLTDGSQTSSGSNVTISENQDASTGQTTSTLTIDNTHLGDAGSYTVTVTDSVDTMTSGPNNLTVRVPPAINSEPANQQTVPGGNAAFTVGATGRPGLSYRWQVSINSGPWSDLDDFAPYSTTTEATVHITSATFAMNGYRYRCVVSHPWTDGIEVSSISNEVMLTVRSVGADFNGDGKSDMIWRHNTGGNVVFWLMNGTTPQTVAEVTPVSTNWTLAGTGDFNSDGKTDVVWRHNTGGNVVFWLMNGTVVANVAEVTPVSTDWMIAGIGDFNGDGKSDIVWRHKTGGNVVFWFMNGTTAGSTVEITPVTNDWTLAATGDFNGDGKSDIVWRHNTGGNVVFWLMNGSAVLNSVEVTPVSTVWTISTTGDFNGDGKTDIVWRHNAGGNVVFWLMNGTVVQSVAEVTPVSTDWTIVR